MKTNPFFETFVSHLTELPSQAKVTQFLSALLTPKEIEEIANRLEIIRLLKEGKSQRDVAQQLGVGIATVTRGAGVLKSGKLDGLLLDPIDPSEKP